MKEKMKPVRIDEDVLKKAQDMGLNVSAIMREAVEKAVKFKKCPTCGQKLKT